MTGRAPWAEPVSPRLLDVSQRPRAPRLRLPTWGEIGHLREVVADLGIVFGAEELSTTTARLEGLLRGRRVWCEDRWLRALADFAGLCRDPEERGEVSA